MSEKERIPTTRLSIGRMRDEERLAVVDMLARLHREQGDIHPTTNRPMSDKRAKSWADNLLETLAKLRKDTLLIARYGDQPAAVLAWKPETNVFDIETVVIEGIYVESEHRRKGIATKLLARLKGILQKEGRTDYIETRVYADNARAMNLLRNMGFFTHARQVLFRLKPTKPDAEKAKAALRKQADATGSKTKPSDKRRNVTKKGSKS